MNQQFILNDVYLSRQDAYHKIERETKMFVLGFRTNRMCRFLNYKVKMYPIPSKNLNLLHVQIDFVFKYTLKTYLH